jgi:polyhydroxybutyrate depolymerase
MRARFAVVLAIALCWSFAPLHAATSSRTVVVQLEVDGHRRTYRLHSPSPLQKPKATAAKLPFVVVLHGAGATGAEVERRYHWDPLADRERFVVAYPQAIDFRWDESGTTDVDFLRALLDDVEHHYPIDASRVFITGISNGGVMTYRAGCALADRLAAIGPVAAWFPDCLPATPVSVVHVHGLEDEVLGFGGGMGYPPVSDGLADWRRADACSDDRTEERAGEVTHVRWAHCAPGTAIELYTIDHGKHEWPGAVPKRGNDPVSHALDATAAIWAFFVAHPRA